MILDDNEIESYLESLPVVSLAWSKEACTKSQRETMDRLRLANRIYYDIFLVRVSDRVGREITSLGKLTKQEASQVIEWLRTPNP